MVLYSGVSVWNDHLVWPDFSWLMTCCRAEVSGGWAILLTGFLAAALQMHGSLAHGQNCEVRSVFKPVEGLLRAMCLPCSVISQLGQQSLVNSMHCCYSRLSGGERHKWLTMCSKLCLKRCSLIVHLHLLSGWKQSKISWPLEAKVMPSKSVPSCLCGMERFLTKWHRMEENNKNSTNEPAFWSLSLCSEKLHVNLDNKYKLPKFKWNKIVEFRIDQSWSKGILCTLDQVLTS